MNDQSERSAFPEWDPLTVLEDQRSAYDDLRRRCPVAHSDLLGWSVLRHADVLDVLHDHDTYRNQVSQHLSVPNGMDPPEHNPYRRLIEPYFGPEPMARFDRCATRHLCVRPTRPVATGRCGWCSTGPPDPRAAAWG